MNYVTLLGEKKTSQMTVYLQPSLLKEMRELKPSGINWSAVARQAFIKKLKQFGRGN